MFAGVSPSVLLKCGHVPHDDDESSGFISAVFESLESYRPALKASKMVI